MIAKSLIAAAAVAGSALSFAAADASAKTNWDIQIGLGGFLPTYELPVYAAPVYRPPVYVEHDYVYDYDYEYDPVPPRRYRPRRAQVHVNYDDHGISCKRGKRVVRSAGFNDVEAYDCSAPTYGYSAWKHGDLFKVRLNTEGDIVSVRQID